MPGGRATMSPLMLGACSRAKPTFSFSVEPSVLHVVLSGCLSSSVTVAGTGSSLGLLISTRIGTGSGFVTVIGTGKCSDSETVPGTGADSETVMVTGTGFSTGLQLE